MIDTKTLQVGIIGGLGSMASPMAKHWQDKDVIKVLRVHDRGTFGPRRDCARKAWQEHGASLVANFDDLVGKDQLDVVFICAGKNGDDLAIIAEVGCYLAKTSPETIICHLSTVSSNFVKAADQYCRGKNIRYVNYPLTGGTIGAENASMLILCGGDAIVYEKLAPVLSFIGKPRYFGASITSGTSVKLIGHLMVFNGLVGICSASALHTESLNNAVFGGDEQIAFLEFLNQGSGGTKQWESALSGGLRKDAWSSGFLIKHAVIDAIYAAQMCMDYKVSWLAIQPIINTALAFSYLSHKVDPDLATQAIAREMVAERALSLDQFIMQHSALVGESHIAIQKCIDSLPDNMKERVALDISLQDFENVALG